MSFWGLTPAEAAISFRFADKCSETSRFAYFLYKKIKSLMIGMLSAEVRWGVGEETGYTGDHATRQRLICTRCFRHGRQRQVAPG